MFHYVTCKWPTKTVFPYKVVFEQTLCLSGLGCKTKSNQTFVKCAYPPTQTTHVLQEGVEWEAKNASGEQSIAKNFDWTMISFLPFFLQKT